MLAVVLCYLDDEWSIQQWLIRVKTLAKSVQGEEMAREVTEVLSAHLHKSTVSYHDRPGVCKWGCNENPGDNLSQSSSNTHLAGEHFKIFGVRQHLQFTLCAQCESSALLERVMQNEYAIIQSNTLVKQVQVMNVMLWPSLVT